MRDSVAVIHRNTQGSPDYIIVVTFEFSQEEGQWVGLCLELGTSAFAGTLEQARLELHDAVELQMSEIERLGFIQNFLGQHQMRALPIDAVTSSGFAGA